MNCATRSLKVAKSASDYGFGILCEGRYIKMCKISNHCKLSISCAARRSPGLIPFLQHDNAFVSDAWKLENNKILVFETLGYLPRWFLHSKETIQRSVSKNIAIRPFSNKEYILYSKGVAVNFNAS